MQEHEREYKREYDSVTQKAQASIYANINRQLEFLTRRFIKSENKAEYIHKQLRTDNSRLNLYALNQFAVRLYNGTDGLKKNSTLAKDIFVFAAEQGLSEAIYNLAVVLISNIPKNLDEACRLFSLLLREIKNSTEQCFNNRKPIIYFHSGLHFFNQQNFKEAQTCCAAVPENSPYSKQARIKTEEIRALTR
jgi:hypothetical protein